ncbi:MAG: serine hydrolase [Phycisphaerales bacterium]|nr:MAG: serine hydrolase [Phycisphaerales bacterium]
MCRLKILLVGLLVGGGPGVYRAVGRVERPVYPGKHWEDKMPVEVGLDVRKLRAISDYAGGFGCVVRHGYMVYTWGGASRRMDVASAAKPVYAHFLFKAVEQGKIAGVDEPLGKWEPRLNQINKKLGYKDRNITWRHCANQVSCYGLVESPGTAFAYNDWQMALFWDTLFQKVYGTTHETVDEKVLHPMLTDPLGCQDNPTFMAFGVGDRPARLAISPRDFARFGLLYLRGGKWRGEQLIGREFATTAMIHPLPNSIPRAGNQAAEMVPGQRSIGSRSIPDNQCDHVGSYSWLWWTNGVSREGERHWPGAPVDTYGCFGHGGMRAMVVIPSLDLIISWNDTRIQASEMENHVLTLLRESVVEPEAQAGQIIVDPEHPQWLKREGMGPFFMCGPGDPEGFLYRGRSNPDGTRDGDQEALIDKLKGTGANCIYLMAVRSHGGDGDSTHNPFIDNDPAQGVNLKVLAQWEKWFAEMDRNGIVIYFFFYDDSTRVWDTGDAVGEEERSFVRTVVDTFEHHRNLIWCVAEEYGERLSAERVRKIAGEIRKADDYEHVVAVHKNHGLDFSEFADGPNIDQFAVQYNVATAEALHEGMVEAWKRAKGRYNLNMSEAADFGSGAQARKKCWACAMAGAYVMILRMDIATTPKSDLEDCGRLVHFFESTNFNEMSPHDELAFAGTQYVLALPGDSYIAYASGLRGKIGLKQMEAGKYEFRWFDCSIGEEVIQKEVDVAEGGRSWDKPEGMGDELAVYVRRVRK